MKMIGEPRTVTAPNGWGHDSTAVHTTYEIEQGDVGTTLANYLGHGKPGVTIKLADVGRQVVKMTDGTAWNCWSWK